MSQLQLVVNGLVPIYQNESKEQLVNARELHEKLGSKQQFANWVQNRIENYGFSEGEEFLIVLLKTPDGGRPRKEYYFKMDAAKELAMVENNEQGKAIRKYFIEIEKKSRAIFAAIPQSLPEALRLAADLAEQLDKQKPLVAFAETCAASQDSVLVRELAKICCKQGINIGEHRLYRRLRAWKMIFPHSTEPYQEYVDRGYFEVTQTAKETAKGTRLFKTTRVTPKGQIYIISRLKEEAVS
jgi:anti-repressor protein